MSIGSFSDTAAYDTPDRTEGKWYDMRAGQVGWLLGWSLLGAAVMLFAESGWVKFIGIPLMAFGVYGSRSGDDGPGYIKLQDRRASRRQARQGGYIEPETAEASGATDTEAGDNKPAQVATKAMFNYGLLGIPFRAIPGEPEELFPTGAVVDRTNKLVSFYFLTHGWNTHAMDPVERKDREQELVDALSKAVGQVDVEHEKVSVSFINGSRPWSPLPTIARLWEELHTDFLRPEEGSGAGRLANNLDKRLRGLAAVGATHINMIVVTTRIPRSWKPGLTDIDVEEAAPSYIKEVLQQGLKDAGFHQPRCLDLLELDEFIQLMWNITKAGEMHQRLFDRRQKLSLGLLSVDEVKKQLLQTNPFPLGLKRVGVDYFYLDGTYFRVYRAKRYRKKRMRPGGLLPLFMNHESPWVINSSCGDIFSAQAEMQRMTRHIVYGRGWRRSKDSTGRYYSKEELAAQTRTERQQDKIFEAEAPVYKFNHFVTVGATSKKELRRYSRKTVGSASRLLIWLVPIRLQARQLRAFANAMLGVNSL